MKSVRALGCTARSPPSALHRLGLLAGRAGVRRRRPTASKRGRAGHPRVVRAAQGAAAAVRGRVRLRPGGRRPRATPAPLTNKLVLTKDDPTGDAAFGIDNTFASRAIDEGVLAPYAVDAARRRGPVRAAGRRRPRPHAGRQRQRLRQRRRHLVRRPRRRPRRQTLDDLAEARPTRTSSSRPAPTTSSPGLAFLLATIAAYGDGRLAGLLEPADGQRRQLTAGLVGRLRGRLHPGRRQGRPADRAVLRLLAGVHRRRRGRTTTSALLDTCFRQVEYAGVLAGAQNPEGAQALVDFMLTPAVQEALPDAMYVFPVDAGVTLPPDWAKFAKQPDHAVHRRPGRHRRAPRRVAAASGATSPPGEDRIAVGPPSSPAWRSGRCGARASSSCCPVSGMIAARLLRRRPVRPRRRCSRCWPGRARTGCSGSRSGRPRWPRWSRCCSGCRRRTCCTGSRSRAADVRPRAAAGAVRAADRRGRRRVPASWWGRPGRWASSGWIRPENVRITPAGKEPGLKGNSDTATSSSDGPILTGTLAFQEFMGTHITLGVETNAGRILARAGHLGVPSLENRFSPIAGISGGVSLVALK